MESRLILVWIFLFTDNQKLNIKLTKNIVLNRFFILSLNTQKNTNENEKTIINAGSGMRYRHGSSCPNRKRRQPNRGKF